MLRLPRYAHARSFELKVEQAAVAGLLAFAVKGVLSRLVGFHDDAHILRIFLAKFAPWTADFHAGLYLAAPEFNPMYAEYRAWTDSRVLPTMLGMFAVVLWLAFRDGGRVNPAHAFLLLLTGAFFGCDGLRASGGYERCSQLFNRLAAMVMRLKLFFSPLMELTAGLLCDASVGRHC